MLALSARLDHFAHVIKLYRVWLNWKVNADALKIDQFLAFISASCQINVL